MNVSTSPLQHGEQARRAVALAGVALAGGPMIFPQAEQSRPLLGGLRLGAAQRHQVEPQIAAAVDLDVAGRTRFPGMAFFRSQVIWSTLSPLFP
jgi:hypothetical protein